MPRSQRLDGFELLRLTGAPVPDWQVAGSLVDVEELVLGEARDGWTIRTCRRDGIREMNLFYRNYAPPGAVREVLRRRVAHHGGNEFYMVYPSWRFIFSCNVVLIDNDFYVEGKYASQKDLALGRARPDFCLRLPFGFRTEMQVIAGTPDERVLRSLGAIINACNKTQLRELYAEVAMMASGALMFYELFELTAPIWPRRKPSLRRQVLALD